MKFPVNQFESLEMHTHNIIFLHKSLLLSLYGKAIITVQYFPISMLFVHNTIKGGSWMSINKFE